MSAALKKGELDSLGYARMIATTTQLNVAGPALAAMDAVHAMTDVTGFGLGGHALELARGSSCRVHIDWNRVPLLEGVRDLAAEGHVTGASTRNWDGYGEDVELPSGFSEIDRSLLTDPQTSGGLLVSCRADAVDDVLAVFQRNGFSSATEIGVIEQSSSPSLRVSV
jgi:selenide,water dikinase